MSCFYSSELKIESALGSGLGLWALGSEFTQLLHSLAPAHATEVGSQESR